MKVGLEVHQQLATGKLFCDCPAELSDEVVATTVRELRATGGENHHIDAAAAFQAARGLRYRYESVRTSCLVELDEEPPHPLDPAAVDVALTMARLLDARILDEVEVMRKIVVDGSNTSGFQRTALVAVDGTLHVADRSYPILSICLEEDAARKVGETDGEVAYRLDRLGIPLIEIATGPEIHSGAEARDVAEEIGSLLRSTGKVRRGIGTIREDLNVSAEGGRRVEIKGVQELRLVHRFVEGEERRQTVLLAARDRLRARGAGADAAAFTSVGEILARSKEGFVGAAVRRGDAALAVRLPGARGVLKPTDATDERLGRELADRARASGLKGLLHSDELPSNGVDAAQVDQIRATLEAGPDDAFAVVLAPSPAAAERALRAVGARFAEAIEGIPGETRDPLPDGRTRYSRPLPGRDRMYPETDVPPIPIDAARLARIDASLPERPEARRRRLVESFAIGEELARQINRLGVTEEFEKLVKEGNSSTIVARLLAQETGEAMAASDHPAVEEFSVAQLSEILRAIREGRFSKEAVPGVLRELLKGAATVGEAAARSGVSALGRDELERLAADVVRSNAALLASRGPQAFAGLMGDLMKQVRGRRDGKEVAAVLHAAIDAALSSGSAPA